jgi:predicted dehydrogenase
VGAAQSRHPAVAFAEWLRKESRTMKILVIGLGGIGQRHARNLRALLGNSLELLAYRVRGLSTLITPVLTADPTRDIEQEYKIRVFNNLESALAESPDAAFVCNPSSLHLDVSLKCVEAGCDLFVEKPLSNSPEGIQRLIDTVQASNRVAMVGYQLRFHPCVQRLRAILAEGTLGTPLAVRAVVGEFLPFWHRYEDYRRMYAARAELGGGVILSQIHELDYLYSLFGVPHRLLGIGGHWSDLEVDVEDTASILMEYSVNGRPLPVHVQLDYLQYPPMRQCEIVGDHGKVVVDLIANTLTLYANRQDEPERFQVAGFERNQLFLDELEHFLHCVRTRQTPMITLHDAAQSLRMAFAAKESISTGRVVEFARSVESARVH